MGSFPYIVQFTVSNDADDLEKLHTGFTIYTAEDDNEPQLAILRDELAAKLATPSDIKIRKTIEAWVRDNKALHNPEDWGEVSIVVPPFLNNPLELFTTRLEGPEVKEND